DAQRLDHHQFLGPSAGGPTPGAAVDRAVSAAGHLSIADAGGWLYRPGPSAGDRRAPCQVASTAGRAAARPRLSRAMLIAAAVSGLLQWPLPHSESGTWISVWPAPSWKSSVAAALSPPQNACTSPRLPLPPVSRAWKASSTVRCSSATAPAPS